MRVKFRIKKREGILTVNKGKAIVEFPDEKLRTIIEEGCNTEQELVFTYTDPDGRVIENTSHAVPAHDDGMLIYYLQKVIRGVKKIEITDVQGSDKVSFRESRSQPSSRAQAEGTSEDR